jgi:hypothetical protein
MAWTVRLQDENGKAVLPEDALIESQSIPVEGNYRLLKYLDPYGDTCFNTLQMDDLLADWGELNPAGHQRQQWILVRDMVLHCKQQSHLYLRFIGD